MSSSKKKPYNITVKQEIDYDKLADAIVKAQKRVVTNKKLSFSRILELSACGMLYLLISIMSGFVIIDTWSTKDLISITPTTSTTFGKILVTFSLLLTSIFSIISHLEMYDDDNIEARGRFNSAITFATFVIACMALRNS